MSRIYNGNSVAKWSHHWQVAPRNGRCLQLGLLLMLLALTPPAAAVPVCGKARGEGRRERRRGHAGASKAWLMTHMTG
jgi:hypothetical protein